MICLVFYSSLFVPKAFAGVSYGPVIFIRPERKEDIGLLEHEKTHAKQFWKNPLFFGLLYRFSKSFRFKSEVEAYRVQLSYYPERKERLAEFLVNGYKLGITKEEALVALS